MRFLVVDKERTVRLYYKSIVENVVPNADVVQSASAEDAIFDWLDRDLALIICSERLSFRSGFALVRFLKKIKVDIPIIIIANDTSNALEAIKSNVFEYLVKPIDDSMFEKVIKDAMQVVPRRVSMVEKTMASGSKMVRLSSIHGFKMVDLDKLAYCLADGSYSKLYFCDGSVDYSNFNLGKIERVLANFNFARINRGAIVNLHLVRWLDRIDESCVLEINGNQEKLKITKSYLKKLEELNVL